MCIVLVLWGDVFRNWDFIFYDEFFDELKYDKFVYEIDKKMWGMDNDNYEDEGEGILRLFLRKCKKYYFDVGLIFILIYI